MFRTKQHYLMMDQNIEHEISSMTYDLLTSGVSEGEQSVLNKALESFTQFISDDFEDCCFYCVQNQISIWDYYGTHSGDTRIPAVLNELWVEFLIQVSDPESQFALK